MDAVNAYSLHLYFLSTEWVISTAQAVPVKDTQYSHYTKNANF